MTQVVLDLRNKSVLEKVALVEQLVAALTGNATFPSPNPALAAMTAGKDGLKAAYLAAQEARAVAKSKTEEQNTQEDAVDALLRSLVAYLQSHAEGNTAAIEALGLSVKADNTPVGELEAPHGLALTGGDDEGELDAHWDKVRGAASYVVEVTDDTAAQSGWKAVAFPTKSSVTLSGLTSGALYWVRVAAIGAAGKSPWSSSTQKRAS